MAEQTADYAQHATLVASTVDTVTLTSEFASFLVVNRGTTNPIYVTFDGTTPAVEGDDTYVVPAEGSLSVDLVHPSKVCKLISAGAMAYSVEGL